ncbi:MAG: glycoside hydrolase family 127 protein [Planctomycetes bacterium]|nr:glycoside hydrolase family 127 protein [Planctomycetota bacterium]
MVGIVIVLFVGTTDIYGAEPQTRSACRVADWPARHAQSQPVPLTQVTVSGYLGKRIDRNLESIIAGTESPIIKNFEARVQGTAKAYRGNADSDISKWIEAASYYAQRQDLKLTAVSDRIVSLMVKCQRKNGDFGSPSTKPTIPLFVAGHFFEAAVAHFRNTGDNRLLEVATAFADYLARQYENGEYIKRDKGDHPEIEVALDRRKRVQGTGPFCGGPQSVLRETRLSIRRHGHRP